MARGYQVDADTSVQLADLRGWAVGAVPSVELSRAADPAWDAAFQSLSGLRDDQQANHRQILDAILPQKCFASVQAQGQIIGCALGVLQNDAIGIYDVVVQPACRRQGHGERLVRSLLGWGSQHGAQTAYLQVMLNNLTAQRLYARLGFREQYQYWYCVEAREH